MCDNCHKVYYNLSNDINHPKTEIDLKAKDKFFELYENFICGQDFCDKLNLPDTRGRSRLTAYGRLSYFYDRWKDHV